MNVSSRIAAFFCKARTLLSLWPLSICILVPAAPSHAAQRYIIHDHIFGDTVALVDISDENHFLWAGFGDRLECITECGSVSGPFAISELSIIGNTFPPIHPSINFLKDHAGTFEVEVRQVNSAGDVFGRALRADSTMVPTLWRADTPYDLSAPQNAHLSFSRDSSLDFTFFNSLDIVANVVNWSDARELEERFRRGQDFFARTNSKGLLVFSSQGNTYAMLVPVSSPGTMLLVGLALAIAATAPTRIQRVTQTSGLKDKSLT